MLGHVKNFSQIGLQTLEMEAKGNCQTVLDHALSKLKIFSGRKYKSFRMSSCCARFFHKLLHCKQEPECVFL